MTNTGRRVFAEAVGSFGSSFCACGAIIAAGEVASIYADIGIATVSALSFLLMGRTAGTMSGSHFNPCITTALWGAGLFPKRLVAPYVAAQCVGGMLASIALYLLPSAHRFGPVGNFAGTGFGALSPAHTGLAACLAVILLATMVLAAAAIRVASRQPSTTDRPPNIATPSFAMIIAAANLVSVPVINGAVNPANSTGQAIFAGNPWIAQLWLFWLVPVATAFACGFAARSLGVQPSSSAE